jgi:hypothetical protein
MLYSGLFLYEDQERRLQNTLEDLWVRVTDRQRAAVSRHVSFMTEVARLEASGFDRVFGKKLLSLRALSTSICFSVVSYDLLMIIFDPDLTQPLYWQTGCIYLVLGILQITFPKLAESRLWNSLLIISTIIILVTLTVGSISSEIRAYPGNTALAFIFSTILMAVSFSCDLFFITITRYSLKWCSDMKRVLPILTMMVLNLVIACALFAIPVSWGVAEQINGAVRVADAFQKLATAPAGTVQWSVGVARPEWNLYLDDAAVMLGGANGLEAIVAVIFFLLLIVLVVHRIAWPLVEKPLYALQRLQPVKKRPALLGLGFVLLAVATGANLERIQKLVEMFTAG